MDSFLVSGSVTLFKQRAKPSAKDTETTTGTTGAPHYKPRSLSVLVVEASAEQAGHVDRTLRRMPWFEAQVTLAGTVEAARFALRAGDVDVVLLAEAADDEALTFARELAAMAGDPPVILMSPLLATEVEYAALDFGVAACIETAELTPRVIETYIRNALWRRAALQPVVSAAAEPVQIEPSPSAVGNVVRFKRRS